MSHSDALRPRRLEVARGLKPSYVGPVALLVAVVLGAGLFGIGHHHGDGEPHTDHQCALCHLQQTTPEPADPPVIVPIAIPHGLTHVQESRHAERRLAWLSPPLRGPPTR